jgi:hypothetical protein
VGIDGPERSLAARNGPPFVAIQLGEHAIQIGMITDCIAVGPQFVEDASSNLSDTLQVNSGSRRLTASFKIALTALSKTEQLR